MVTCQKLFQNQLVGYLNALGSLKYSFRFHCLSTSHLKSSRQFTYTVLVSEISPWDLPLSFCVDKNILLT